MLAARPVPRRRWLRAQARTIPARTVGALSIASANGATAIISFSIASRPGGLANEQRYPMPGSSGPAPAGAHKAPEIGKQLEKT